MQTEEPSAYLSGQEEQGQEEQGQEEQGQEHNFGQHNQYGRRL